MKKFLILFATLFIGIVAAHAVTINWYVDDEIYDSTTCTIGNNITPPTPPAKYGYTFTGWVHFFSPIEYIELSGEAYIDTGIKPNQDTRVVIEYLFPTAHREGWPFGVRSGPSYRSFSVLYSGSNKWRSDYGDNNVEGPSLTADCYDHKIKIDKNKNIMNAYDESNNALASITNSVATFNTDYSLIFPGLNNAGVSGGSRQGVRIYSFKMYDNDTLLLDLIPVLDPENVPCMYDKVSKTYFYKTGSGSFIAGPIVNE